MSDDYEVIDGYKDLEFEGAILLYDHIIDFDIWSVQIWGWCNKYELEYYKKAIENNKKKRYRDDRNPNFLMIISVKQKIPFIKCWDSFDLEIVVLEFKHLSKYSIPKVSILTQSYQFC